jgi:cytochrome c oxidase subunit 2
MTRATLAKLIAAMLALGTVTAVVMVQFNWNGEAASAEAGKIDDLLDVMIILSSYVFAIVLIMLGYSIWRYRAKPGDESDGEPIHGNTKLEVAWTVIPTVIVLFAAVYSWVTLNDIEVKAADRMNVNVTAQQYKWTFEYPDHNVKSGQLHVPVGTQLNLTLSSLDVIHSFWVPEWRIKRDVVPTGEGNPQGVEDQVVVTPDVEGSYNVVCTELCGVGHASMRALVVVESQRDFDAWINRQPTEEAAATGGSAGGA